MTRSTDSEWTPPLDGDLPPIEDDWRVALEGAPSMQPTRGARPAVTQPPDAGAARTPPLRHVGVVPPPPNPSPSPRGPLLPITERQAALDALHERIGRCTACALHRTRTRAVPGSGSAGARIMAIGEAPGEREDREGVPFVGAAGRLLTRLLTDAGIPREALYITNVLKSRPPGNRDPEPSEVAACSGFLEEQIALLAPEVILLLGRHALLRVLPGAPPISRCHGQRLQLGGRVYVPLYHPAAALYNGSMLRTLEEDMRQVRGYLDEADETRRRAPAQASSATSAQAEPEADAQSEPETDAEAQPEADAQTEPETDAETEPETVARTEPETVARTEPETTERTEPETAAAELQLQLF